jgi:hypothetical protein
MDLDWDFQSHLDQRIKPLSDFHEMLFLIFRAVFEPFLGG